jgi:hypothetical protein
MLLTSTTRVVIEVAGGLVFLVGGALFMLSTRGTPQLPPARIGSRRRARRITAAPFVVLGMLTMYWAGRHSIDILVVRDGHSPYGNRALERRLASDLSDYRSVEIGDEIDAASLANATCWLVNASSGPLRYDRLDYEYRHSDVKTTGSVVIAPGQRAPYCPSFGNDYIGPNFPPPASAKDSARTLRASAWLTWD